MKILKISQWMVVVSRRDSYLYIIYH